MSTVKFFPFNFFPPLNYGYRLEGEQEGTVTKKKHIFQVPIVTHVVVSHVMNTSICTGAQLAPEKKYITRNLRKDGSERTGQDRPGQAWRKLWIIEKRETPGITKHLLYFSNKIM